jgi:4-azaleucine resistance transporter AzlC
VKAFKISLPVGMGMVPLGIAFGVLVVQSGLDWWWATLCAAVVYAGSFEYLLVGLVAAAAPLATIASTALLVNVRHVFYGPSFPLHRVRGIAKLYSTYAMTDEVYALTTAPRAQSWPGRRIVALQLYLHAYWVAGATIGALLGTRIPAGITGFDFALTAMFVVLALEALRRDDLPTPLLALAAALIGRLTFPEQMLPVAFTLFTAALLLRRRLLPRRWAFSSRREMAPAPSRETAAVYSCEAAAIATSEAAPVAMCEAAPVGAHEAAPVGACEASRV